MCNASQSATRWRRSDGGMAGCKGSVETAVSFGQRAGRLFVGLDTAAHPTIQQRVGLGTCPVIPTDASGFCWHGMVG